MRRIRIIHVSPKGATWLALLEGGYKLKAYQDDAGVWTISAGCTYYSHGARVKKGDVLDSPAAAELLFRERLLEYEAEVDARTRDDITQTEFDCLTSFCFNAGAPNFRTSTALRRFNDKSVSLASVAEAMCWFNKITDPTTGKLVYSEGLMERRRCESYLLMYGLYRVQKQPKPEPPE